MSFFKGLKNYYKKDKWAGVRFFIRTRMYHRLFKHLIFADWHYVFDPYRVITKRYEEDIPLVDSQFQPYGNYFLYKPIKIKSNSVVYSLGVLNDTSFDKAIADEAGCQVHLFDPSIIATRHIKAMANKNFIFQEVAVWNKPSSMTFYTPTYGGSPSMVFDHPGRQFEANCKTLPMLMNEYGHSSINVIKLDVEGAAPTILHHMLDAAIYPEQVIVELERKKTKSVRDFLAFFRETDDLISRFRSLGYQVYRMPREAFKYYSLELILVRK